MGILRITDTQCRARLTACAKRFFAPALMLRREKSGAAHSPARFIRPRRRGRSNLRLTKFFLADSSRGVIPAYSHNANGKLYIFGYPIPNVGHGVPDVPPPRVSSPNLLSCDYVYILAVLHIPRESFFDSKKRPRHARNLPTPRLKIVGHG